MTRIRWSMAAAFAVGGHCLAILALVGLSVPTPPSPPPLEPAVLLLDLPAAPQPSASAAVLSPSRAAQASPPTDPPKKPRRTAVKPQPEPNRPPAPNRPTTIETALPHDPVPSHDPAPNVTIPASAESAVMSASSHSPPPQSDRTTNATLSGLWQARLLAHLERYKLYPEDARRRHLNGSLVLTFTMNQHGHVLSRLIRQTSGHAALDRAALDMLDRAQPLPEPPSTMAADPITLSVPIRFSLR